MKFDHLLESRSIQHFVQRFCGALLYRTARILNPGSEKCSLICHNAERIPYKCHLIANPPLHIIVVHTESSEATLGLKSLLHVSGIVRPRPLQLDTDIPCNCSPDSSCIA